MTINKSTTIFTIIAFLLIGGMLLVSRGVPVAEAGSELPSRATPKPASNDDSDRSEPVGAYIELAGAETITGGWSVVQWQDSNGDWHNVEGWQGAVSDSRSWWVHPKDFGRGPFRWVVQSTPGGSVSASSAPFHLPTSPNKRLQVPVK